MKRKYKWYQIILLIFGAILASPIYIFVGFCMGIQFVFTFPKEYPIYRKSKYRSVYKRRYKMGIINSWDFKFFEKLLDNDYTFYRSKNNYGYPCFYNDDYCFTYLEVNNIKFESHSIVIKKSEGTPYITIDDFITKEKSSFIEAVNKKFFITLSVVDSKGNVRTLDQTLINQLIKHNIYLITMEDTYANLFLEILNADKSLNKV